MYNDRLNKSLAIVIMLFIGQLSPCAAEFDPTRPPIPSKSSPVVKTVKVNPGDYKVTSILISPQRKIAVVNNQVVTQGDKVIAAGNGKVTVKHISTSAVVLVKSNHVFKVRLPSAALSKIHRGKPLSYNPLSNKKGDNENPVGKPPLSKTTNNENNSVKKETH